MCCPAPSWSPASHGPAASVERTGVLQSFPCAHGSGCYPWDSVMGTVQGRGGRGCIGATHPQQQPLAVAGVTFIHPSLSPVSSFPNQLETLGIILRGQLGRKAACRGRWSTLAFNSNKDLHRNRVKNYCPGAKQPQSRVWENRCRGDAGLPLGCGGDVPARGTVPPARTCFRKGIW